MRQNIFLILFSFLVVNTAYSQCVVDVQGPSFLCKDNPGTHQLHAVGSFTNYLWSPGGQTSQTIDISAPGIYTVTATDVMGCQAVDSLVVSYAPDIVPDIQVSSDHVCLGDNLHMTVSGAGAGGSYLWDNGLGTSQTHDFVVGTSGPVNYHVTLTDAYGCTADSYITIVGVDVPSVQIAPSTVTICKGDGVQLNATSLLSTNGNTSYSWFPTYGLSNSTSPNVVASPPSSTEYTITESNELGGTVCSASASVVVNVDEFNLSPPLQQSVCKGAETSIVVTQSGGIPPYNYAWTVEGVSEPNLNGQLNFLDVIDHNTTYNVFGVDGNGCQVSKTFTINVYPDLNLQAFVNLDTVCPGEPVLFNATISGGTGHPYEFILDGQYSSTITTIYPKETHDYVISAEDACHKVFDTITIYTYPVPYVDFIADEYGGCVPYTTKFTPILQPEDLVVSYAWNFGETDGNNFSSLASPSHTYMSKGQYDVRLEVRTADNCFTDTVKTNLITVQSKPTVNFDAEPLRASIIEPTIFFTNTSSDKELLDFAWNFGDGEISNLLDPPHYYGAVGTYPVELIGTTTYGCSDTVVQSVEIIPEITIYIPTAFTPNNDGYNETFLIKGTNISSEDYQLTIWDRDGNKVFTSKSMDDSWDGKHYGTDTFVMPGYYYYLLNYKDVYGAEYEKSGEINVIY